jgi:hypothetical protein
MTTANSGAVLVLLIAVALLIEALTQRSKETAAALLGRELSSRWDIAFSVMWGLVLAFAFRLDVLKIVADWTGYPTFAPWWIGTSVGGLLGSRLSNIFHDLAAKIEKRPEVIS